MEHPLTNYTPYSNPGPVSPKRLDRTRNIHFWIPVSFCVLKVVAVWAKLAESYNFETLHKIIHTTEWYAACNIYGIGIRPADNS